MRKWSRYVFVGIIGMILCFLLYARTIARAPITAAQQKKNVIYPIQYSDTHITENARTTDPRFKNLAIFNTEHFLANVVSSLQVRYVCSQGGTTRKRHLALDADT